MKVYIVTYTQSQYGEHIGGHYVYTNESKAQEHVNKGNEFYGSYAPYESGYREYGYTEVEVLDDVPDII